MFMYISEPCLKFQNQNKHKKGKKKKRYLRVKLGKELNKKLETIPKMEE